MRVRKYIEFIKENMYETPENYIGEALKQLKRKIDKMFDFQEEVEGNYPVEGEDATPEKIKKIRTKSKDKMSFEDLGVRLESSEISKYSKLYDSLTVKFSDDNATYALIITIDIKEGIPKDKEKDFDIDDIENKGHGVKSHVSATKRFNNQASIGLTVNSENYQKSKFDFMEVTLNSNFFSMYSWQNTGQRSKSC